MIENVVNVGAEANGHALGYSEVFVYSEVHTPLARAHEYVAPCDSWIAEEVRADWRHTECPRVPYRCRASALPGVEVLGNNGRPQVRKIEIPDCIDRAGPNVAGEDRITVIADPVWRVRSSRLCKHVERGLPSPDDGVDPARHALAKRALTSYGQIVNAIRDHPMPRHETIRYVVTIRVEDVIGNRPQARVGGIAYRGFLIQQGV